MPAFIPPEKVWTVALQSSRDHETEFGIYRNNRRWYIVRRERDTVRYGDPFSDRPGAEPAAGAVFGPWTKVLTNPDQWAYGSAQAAVDALLGILVKRTGVQYGDFEPVLQAGRRRAAPHAGHSPYD